MHNSRVTLVFQKAIQKILKGIMRVCSGKTVGFSFSEEQIPIIIQILSLLSIICFNYKTEGKMAEINLTH